MPVPCLTQPLFKLTVLNTLPCCYIVSNTCNLLSMQFYYISAYQTSLPIVLFPFIFSIISQIFFSFYFLVQVQTSWYIYQILEFFTVSFFIYFIIIIIFIIFKFFFISVSFHILLHFLHFLHFLFVFLSSFK